MRLELDRRGASKFAAVAALALALALSGCGLNDDLSFERGYQVDEETLAKVKVGSTSKTEALALMGTPSTTSTVGGDAWYYIGQKMSRPVMFMNPTVSDQSVTALYFDKGGKVARIGKYGLKDGEVFDYVSETTPTGGTEPSFLRNILTGLLRF